jgi:hypothetical protein
MTKLLVLIAAAMSAVSPHPPDLQRKLATTFAVALDRLAVSEQPPGDGADLGQNLPHGIVDRVSCAGTLCTIHWLTASRRPRTTDYVVGVLPNGCISAAADPPLPAVRDATIKTYTDNPLNTIGSTC